MVLRLTLGVGAVLGCGVVWDFTGRYGAGSRDLRFAA